MSEAPPLFQRHPANPVVIFEHGKFWMFERAAGGLRPFICQIGALVSDDVKRVTYRMGAMLLALDDPGRVPARCPRPLLQPETYYERIGAYIPNVVFPNACVARASLSAVVVEVLRHPV